ncbi:MULTISPECIES: peptide deformylase [unclassified Neochlamydia]|uniref:peptide deformylase n=1 Tax=unclassified Neochlamydia TaxID=2643326 RepID=UPI001F60CCA6|nr:MULTISPECIES: peptide deformylase [unclassified Neochlamydia]NGY96084.1 Peptide deformylase [Neochlamydia sp. AcF84]
MVINLAIRIAKKIVVSYLPLLLSLLFTAFMILQLAYYGDPILRKKTETIKEINSDLRQLAANMLDTMYAEKGIGLAGPQVRQSIAIFVTCVPTYINDETSLPGVERIFINPKILSYSEESDTLPEGCLSIPKVSGLVTRPLKIVVQAMDLDAKTFTEEFVGYEARCILHENDHLNGKLFIDRMASRTDRQNIESKLREIKRKYSFKS